MYCKEQNMKTNLKIGSLLGFAALAITLLPGCYTRLETVREEPPDYGRQNNGYAYQQQPQYNPNDTLSSDTTYNGAVVTTDNCNGCGGDNSYAYGAENYYPPYYWGAPW